MAKKVDIIINNQKSKLVGDLKVKMKLAKALRIKSPGYFWSPAWRQHKWDGFVQYFGEDSGMFKTGLLPMVIEQLKEMGVKYELEDNRELFKDIHVPEELGDKDFRDYQHIARKSVIENRIGKVRFQRGIIDAATNAGKSLIAGGIIASYSTKRTTLFMTNSKTLFDQAYPDLIDLFGKEAVGRVNADYSEWKQINVVMAQTLEARMKKDPKYRTYLAKVDIMIVDEADELIGRKGVGQILEYAYNATIRVALTGTALKHKDPLRNRNLLAYFGPILFTITNKELVERGVSTKPIIKITKGNTRDLDESYADQYKFGIIRNRNRHRKIWKRVEKNIKKGRIPILILFREHEHAQRLVEEIPFHISNEFSWEIVHGETPNREGIFERFNKGKINILIASMIIKRGKNLPLVKVLINAAGGDSEVTVLQIFGRLLRSHKTKKVVYMEDFWDLGRNLRRHSYHRTRYYKKQGFPVKELYKNKLNK